MLAWEVVPLEQLVPSGRSISYGIVQPGAPVVDGVPIVRVNDVRDGRISTRSPMCVAPTIEAAYSRTRLRGGELLLTLVGTVGETAVVPTSLSGWNTARAVGVIPVREDVGAYWVQLALRAPEIRHIIDSRLNTTVQATLNLGDVAKLPIVLPPCIERQRIANVIGALDDKIELNRRMNETLEAMARAIFKSWFIDFDPVRINADRRARRSRGAAPPCAIPDEVLALFPESFEDSDLGEIPAGWRVDALRELCSVEIGGDWGEDTTFSGAIEVLCLRGVDLEHLRASGTATPPLRWIKPTSLQKRRMDERDVLIAGSGAGPCGRPLWVSDSLQQAFEMPMTYSNFCKRLRCRDVVHAVFVDQILHEMHRSSEVWEYASGTSVPNLDINGLLQGKRFIIPTAAVLQAFADFMRPINKRLYNPESRILAALRDALLPKLLSGEIRVKDAERFVEKGALVACPASGVPVRPAGAAVRPIIPSAPAASRVAPQAKSGGVTAIAERERPHPPERRPADDDAPARPLPIEEYCTEDVMCALRQALRGRGAMTRDELIKATSVRLGYQRVGPKIDVWLREHMMAAIRRRIVGRDGRDYVYAETQTIDDYSREELQDGLISVMRKGCNYARETICYDLAWHFGFARVTDAVRDAVKSAINGAIRKGILAYDGEWIWREE